MSPLFLNKTTDRVIHLSLKFIVTYRCGLIHRQLVLDYACPLIIALTFCAFGPWFLRQFGHQ